MSIYTNSNSLFFQIQQRLYGMDPDLLFLEDAMPSYRTTLQQELGLKNIEDDIDIIAKLDWIIRANASGLLRKKTKLLPYRAIIQIVAKKLQIPLSSKQSLTEQETIVAKYIRENPNTVAKIPKIKAISYPNWQFVCLAIDKLEHIRSYTKNQMVIALVGSPSAGKDTALLKLFGIDTGNYLPIAGSTSDIEIYHAKEKITDDTEHLVHIINTPGLGDVRENVTLKAREILSVVNVFVYMLNSEGGLQARELSDLQNCLAHCKNDPSRHAFVLLNKIDCLRPKDKEAFLSHVHSNIGDQVHIIEAALDPLPGVMEPMGIVESRKQIGKFLDQVAAAKGIATSVDAYQQCYQQPPPPASSLDAMSFHAISDSTISTASIYESPLHSPIRTAKQIFLGCFFIFIVNLSIFIMAIYLVITQFIFPTISEGIEAAKELSSNTISTISDKTELPTISDIDIEVNSTIQAGNQIRFSPILEGKNSQQTTISMLVVVAGKIAVEKDISNLDFVWKIPVGQYSAGSEIIIKMRPTNLLKKGDWFTKKVGTIVDSPTTIEKLSASWELLPCREEQKVICNAQLHDLDREQATLSFGLLRNGNILQQSAPISADVSSPFSANFSISLKPSAQKTLEIDQWECAISLSETEKKSTQIDFPSNIFDQKTIFVMNVKSANMGGLAGADRLCQTEAQKAKRKGLFKAWLSSSDSSPATRFQIGLGKYVRTDGSVYADDWCAMTRKDFSKPIRLNAFGHQIQPRTVFSMTDWRGEFYERSEPNQDFTCQDWKSEKGTTYVGKMENGFWPLQQRALPCKIGAIYCVEQ